MTVEKIAEDAVKRLVKAFPGFEFTEDQMADVGRIIEEAMSHTVGEAATEYRKATVMCCGPESDLAHKIAEETERRTELLVSSLSHLR